MDDLDRLADVPSTVVDAVSAAMARFGGLPDPEFCRRRFRKSPRLRFAFRLAAALGEWDVPAMLAEMPEWLFRYWMHFYEVDPFGEERGDIRSALAATALVRTWGGKVEPDHFLPFRDRDEDEGQDAKVMIAKCHLLAAAHNASH